MNIEKAKQSAIEDIRENIKYLYEVINSNNHPQKEELNKLLGSNTSYVEDAIGNITILYYIFAFSNDKKQYLSICSEVKKTISQNLLVKSLYSVYTELIEIQDINPNLTQKQAAEKNKELLNFLSPLLTK